MSLAGRSFFSLFTARPETNSGSNISSGLFVCCTLVSYVAYFTYIPAFVPIACCLAHLSRSGRRARVGVL